MTSIIVELNGRRFTPETLSKPERESQEQEIPAMPQPLIEMAETIRAINSDKPDKKTGMTDVDFNSRLNIDQVTQYSVLDFLVSMRFLPKRSLALTRQLKRVHVSLNGEGRKEIVTIAKGEREHEEKKSLGQRISGMFGGGGGTT